jgi:threonine/homoserine/homoserine lactone efflux protein
MNSEYFISFLTISFLFCLSPGPSMLFIIHQGLSTDWKNVVAGISGLIAANIIWITLCSLGVGALMQSSQQVFIALKYIGAMYLIYLGLSSILSKNKSACSTRRLSENAILSKLFVIVKKICS